MAGSKVDLFETNILKLLFQNVDLANIGNAGGLLGSTVAGSFFIALFTADPTDAGVVTNECDYTGYARKAVARSAGEWSISDGAAENANIITFDQCTGGSNTATHWGVCKAGSASVQDMIYHGDLDSSLAISNGITPEIAAGDMDISED